MSKILFILNTAFDVSSVNQIAVNKTQSRVDQFTDGFKSFFNFDYGKYNHEITFIITDNTIEEQSDIDDDILNNIPLDCVIFNLEKDNYYGSKNKGSGVLTSWVRCKSLIKENDYIVHFEPRLLLISHHLIELFLEDPKNIFTIGGNGRQFNTGLFSISSKEFLGFINTITPKEMFEGKVSLENILYNYAIGNNINFDNLKEMGVVWHDSYTDNLLKM